MKYAQVCIATLAAWCATAIASKVQLTITEPAKNAVFYFGDELSAKDPAPAVTEKNTDSDSDSASDDDDDDAPVLDDSPAEFNTIPVRIKGFSSLPTKVYMVLERKSIVWRKFDEISVISKDMADDLVKFRVDPAKAKDGDYRIKIMADRGGFSLFKRRKTLDISDTFKLRAIGRVSSWVPSFFRIVQGVAFGDSHMGVVYGKDTRGRKIHYEVKDALSLKVVAKGDFKTFWNYAHTENYKLNSEKMPSNGKYFVEFMVPTWRMWKKYEPFYRSRFFTLAELTKKPHDPLQLLKAVKQGDIVLAQRLIDEGANLNQQDYYGNPLTVAAKEDDIAMVKLLLDKGADPNEPSSGGYTALLSATMNQFVRLDIVKWLLLKGANPNVYDNYVHQTPLDRAFEYNHEALIELLFDYGADPKLVESLGKSPLVWAVKNQNFGQVQLLLAKGVLPDVGKFSGRSPLLQAAFGSDFDIAQVLLQAGAIPDSRDESDATPLLLAVRNDDLKMAELLLDMNARLELADKKGVTPLLAAITSVKMSQLLLERGANANVADVDGNTPLLKAALFGAVDVMRLLLQSGADLNLANNSGMTPLLAAAKDKMAQWWRDDFVPAVQWILENSSDLEERNAERIMALVQVAKEGNMKAVRKILKSDQPPIVPINPQAWA